MLKSEVSIVREPASIMSRVKDCCVTCVCKSRLCFRCSLESVGSFPEIERTARENDSVRLVGFALEG